MQLHKLKRHTANKKAKRIGRAGARGKTSGRGTKGQKARAGHRIRPEIRDLIKKIPKQRGYQFAATTPAARVVNVGLLDTSFSTGETVSRATLRAKRLVPSYATRIKILGTGSLSKALTVTGILVSAEAQKKIESAGGKVTK